MPEGRPPYGAELERALFVEAGHRCAITRCRATTSLQIDHIDDWAKVKEHRFENMIVLCANCHGMKGEGRRRLDRKSLRQYKANLGQLNHQYGEVERRVLTYFAMNPDANLIYLPNSTDVLIMYLLRDGILEHHRSADKATLDPWMGPLPIAEAYLLTPEGHELVERFAKALPLNPSPGGVEEINPA